MPDRNAAELGAQFDPVGFFEFDHAEGSVAARGGPRVIVLSDTALAPLVSAAVRNGDLKAVRRLGRTLGHLVAGSLPADAASLRTPDVLSHAAGVLGLFGWGRLHLERWGPALVARLAKPPALDEGHLAVAALLGGLFSELGGQDVACVPVGHDGSTFVLLHPSVAEEVWNWAREGAPLGDIVARLTRGES